MASIPVKQEKQNVIITLLMVVTALLFILYMGCSLVHSTQAFWNE